MIVERTERQLIPSLRRIDDSLFVELRRQLPYRSVPQTSPPGRAGICEADVLLSTIGTGVPCVLEITGGRGKG